MKKILFGLFCILLLSGCSKSLNCSLSLNEDSASTNINVSYNFSTFGKQISRDESNVITFQNMEDFEYYKNQVDAMYNKYNDSSLNYNFTSDKDLMTVKITRQITNSDIDKSSLNELEPSGNLNYKKVKKYYENNGYNCE